MADTFWILTWNNMKVSIPLVVSITEDDEVIYDGDTYRNEFTSRILGRAVGRAAFAGATFTSKAATQGTFDSGTGTPAATGTGVALDGTVTLPSGFPGAGNTDKAFISYPTYQTQTPVVADEYFEKSDSYVNTPPREWPKKHTIIRFWSEAAGTGKMLFRMREDKIEMFGCGEEVTIDWV